MFVYLFNYLSLLLNFLFKLFILMFGHLLFWVIPVLNIMCYFSIISLISYGCIHYMINLRYSLSLLNSVPLFKINFNVISKHYNVIMVASIIVLNFMICATLMEFIWDFHVPTPLSKMENLKEWSELSTTSFVLTYFRLDFRLPTE